MRLQQAIAIANGRSSAHLCHICEPCHCGSSCRKTFRTVFRIAPYLTRAMSLVSWSQISQYSV